MYKTYRTRLKETQGPIHFEGNREVGKIKTTNGYWHCFAFLAWLISFDFSGLLVLTALKRDTLGDDVPTHPANAHPSRED